MTKHKRLWGFAAVALIALLAWAGYQAYATNLAHTTFERYYAFRGCVELVDKTDSSAHCKLPSGEVIKLVLINNKWYLDGDGPGVW